MPQHPRSQQLPGETWKSETPPSQKRSEAITSSLNYIGGTIKNALEEGRAVVENKTADIIQETCKLNIRRKGAVSNTQGEAGHKLTHKYLPQNPLDHETQLKASRDVRWQIGVTRYVASVLHFACLNPLYGKCQIYSAWLG